MSGPFPTIFAKMIGMNCGLYIDDDERGNENVVEYLELKERLIVFQQISIAANFETALQAYYDYVIDDKQSENLKLIHATTKSWLLGYVAGNLLDSLESKMTTGRDRKEIAQMIVEHFIKPEQATIPTEKKGLLIQFAGLKEIPKLISKKEDE